MKKRKETRLFSGKWLEFCVMELMTSRGEIIEWEFIKRKVDISGMVVIPQMLPSKRFVLIKQYRPAIEGYVISFPAGLATGDVQHALVELKEETGYTGTIVSVSPELVSNSGVMNTPGRAVYVHIDETDPRNACPCQELEPSEDIEVFLVEKDDVKSFLIEEQNKGAAIGANLWYLFGLSPLLA